MTKPLTKADLEAAFKAIESHKLRPDVVYMSEEAYLDLMSQKKCRECGGTYSNRLSNHPVDDCNLHKVFSVMES